MRDALAVSPDTARYWNNLGVVLKKQGKLGDAAGAYCTALARDPGLAGGWTNLCDALRSLPPEDADTAIERDLVACFSRDELPHQDLAHTALRFLHGTDELRSLVARLGTNEPKFLDQAPLRALCTPLLVAVMERVLMPDPILESILARARRELLALVLADAPSSSPTEAHERLAAALARQCFLNEYVYAVSEDERAALAALRAAIEGKAPAEDRLARLRILVFGSYAPLHGLTNATALEATARGQSDARLHDIVRRQVTEPLEERRVGAAIASFGAVTDATSRKVRDQYEDNPYPPLAQHRRACAAPGG